MTESLKDQIRRIVATQSEGYLIAPTATAFVAEGLDHQEVEQVLLELQEDGHVGEQEEVIQTFALDDDGQVIYEDGEPKLIDALGDDGQPIIIHSGWEITEEGRDYHLTNQE